MKTNNRRFITNKVARMLKKGCLVLTPQGAKERVWYPKCARPYFFPAPTKRKNSGLATRDCAILTDRATPRLDFVGVNAFTIHLYALA